MIILARCWVGLRTRHDHSRKMLGGFEASLTKSRKMLGGFEASLTKSRKMLGGFEASLTKSRKMLGGFEARSKNFTQDVGLVRGKRIRKQSRCWVG